MILDDVDHLSRMRDTVELTPSQLPMLVRFRNIHDPRTVERVNPDDLGAIFGPGVRLLHATIAITADPVTTGTVKQLEWLNGSTPTLPDNVNPDAFKY